MKVAALVVTYNRKELLQECLLALLEQNAPVDIIVVDNACTDGSMEAMADLVATCGGRISWIRLDQNTGGAGGFCRGMEIALARGYDRVWIMDDDCICPNDALDRLLIADRDLQGKYGFLASKVCWTDGSDCRMNKVGEAGMQSEVGLGLSKTCVTPVRSATFVSLMFPAAVIAEMGLPLEEYFIWGDDKEYTLRISAKYPCYQVMNSLVTHKTGNNEGSNIKTDDPERVDRYFYAYRNDLATAKSRGAGAVLVYLAGFALNFFRVLFSGTSMKGKRIKTMWRGFTAGMKFHPAIRYVSLPEEKDENA